MKRFYFLLTLLLCFQAGNAQIIINEVLYDPSNSSLDGDANGDGMYDQDGDSFIEFVNTGLVDFDMSGYEIWDDVSSSFPEYTIPSGTIIPPNGALVVFGSGTPTGNFGGAIVLTAGGSGFSFNNSGEVIAIKDTAGQVVLSFDSDALSNNPNESYTRNPDITGAFEQHSDNTPLLFSPGTQIDGTPFDTVFVSPPPVLGYTPMVINEVLYDPSNSSLDGDANGDGTYDQEGDAFIEFINTDAVNYDMSGYMIWDDTTSGSLIYTIPSGTIIPPGGALVVFGGGTPTGTFGGATVLSVGGASGLSLNNSGEIITVFNTSNEPVLTFDSDALSNNPNESYTRNPDVTGNFEQHNDNTPLLFSPGTEVDGTPFNTVFNPPMATLPEIDSIVAINANKGVYRAYFGMLGGSDWRLEYKAAADASWRQKTIGDANQGSQKLNITPSFGTNVSVRLAIYDNGSWVEGAEEVLVVPCKTQQLNIVVQQDAFCGADSVLVRAGYAGGYGAASFMWSNGASTKRTYANQGETLSVVVTDAVGCTISDSVTAPSVDLTGVPSNFVLTKDNATTFTGTWTAPSLPAGASLIGYRMAYRLRNTLNWTSTSLSPSPTATVDFTGSGLMAGNYEFVAYTRYNNGTSAVNSNFTCRDVKGYNGSGNKRDDSKLGADLVSNLSVYPNPTTDYVNVVAANMSQLTLTDLQGRVIQSQVLENESVQLDMSNLSEGVYIVRIVSETETFTQTVIKK